MAQTNAPDKGQAAGSDKIPVPGNLTIQDETDRKQEVKPNASPTASP